MMDSSISFDTKKLTLANSSDPDEMQHSKAFHLDLICLTTYQFYVSTIEMVHKCSSLVPPTCVQY